MRLLGIVVLSVMAAKSAFAHEFWIEPQTYQVAPGQEVVANLRNGQEFNGGSLSWFDHRKLRSEARMDGVDALVGRDGDLPAIQYTPEDAGLLRLVHKTVMDRITYKEAEKFSAFVEHKDLDTSALPAPVYPFKEGYTRFVKSLIAVGDAQGQDDVAGLEIEFLALKNPYVDDLSDGLPVRLIYQGVPRGNAQVEVFEKSPDGEVLITLLRTDAQGEAVVAVKPDHSYLLDSVVLRLPTADIAEEKGIVWETLWAAMTFAVPK